MIKPPSLQSTYTWIWSRDPALQLPEDPAEAERVIRIARQTGQYPIADGQQPTLFQLRSLTHSDISWVTGEQRSSSEHGRALSLLEANVLTIRLALNGLDNFGTHKVQHGAVGSKRRVATVDIIDALYSSLGESGDGLIAELADHIVHRVRGVIDPL